MTALRPKVASSAGACGLRAQLRLRPTGRDDAAPNHDRSIRQRVDDLLGEGGRHGPGRGQGTSRSATAAAGAA